MKWRLYTALVGFVLFGVPLIIISLGGLGMQAKFENAINGETSVPAPIADAGGTVLNVWGNFREGREIDALFVADSFTRRRSITFKERVTVADVLAEDEAAPPPEHELLWVLARASQYALDAECPVVLETFGRACAVSSAKVDETSEEGVYEIEAVVGYLPDHDLGSTEVDGPRDLYRARVRLPREGGIAVSPEGRAAAKRTLYQEVERACDGVREQRQNCVISDLQLRSQRARADGSVPYYITANLYTVGPKGTKAPEDDLVGSYGSTFAQNTAGIGQKLGILDRIGALFGVGPTQTASNSDGPRIIRGGHNRYRGSDGRFIPARER